MKTRTGKECKKINCKHWSAYSNWANYMGTGDLSQCRECKNAHVSQYVPVEKQGEGDNVSGVNGENSAHQPSPPTEKGE